MDYIRGIYIGTSEEEKSTCYDNGYIFLETDKGKVYVNEGTKWKHDEKHPFSVLIPKPKPS